MKINELFDTELNFAITGIVDDSRDVKDGYLFVATKGFNVDHYDYIDMAIRNGAVCVVADREVDCSVPVFYVEDINNYYVLLCKKFNNILDNDFDYIGVTGTDGKTTSTSIINQILSKHQKCALIGTNGMFIGDDKYNTSNTTPCVSELYDVLGIAKANGCKQVVMEVSSEALLHNRVEGIKYSIVGFTNITEDHLNVHGSIGNYIECKLKLLEHLKEDGVVVYNGDDVNLCQIKGYSFGVNQDCDFVISNVIEESNVVKFNITYKGVDYDIVSPLVGLYNVYNVTMAFAICLLYGVEPSFIIECIKDLKPIYGRREYLDFGQNFDLILDYAHTFNGIKSILESCENYKTIITVTGAAGGREVEKRSKIGKIVLEKSDVVVFTMDDPRYESVDKIIDDLAGDTKKEYFRIKDRVEAIHFALKVGEKNPGSVVLILGKGRDNYMAIEDKKVPYCDYDVIKEYYEK